MLTTHYTTVIPAVCCAMLGLSGPGRAAVSDSGVQRSALLAALEPVALAAARCTPLQASQVYQELAGASARLEAVAMAETAVQAAVAGVTTAQETLRADPSSEAARVAFRQAQQALEAARLSMDSAADLLRGQAMSVLPGEVQSRLSAIRGKGHRRMPPEFAVLERTAEQWGQIEAALIQEQRALRQGQVVPSAAAAVLGPIRADPSVVGAAQNIANSLPQISAAFATLAGPG